LDFYLGAGTDSEGRTLQEIWAWDNDKLEEVHDFIQWLFPLPEPSQFNPDAPLLTDDHIAAFRRDSQLQANLLKSFNRILDFLGLIIKDGNVIEGDNFSDRISDVWAIPNHNWLRITRILRSVTLLGLGAQAKALYERLSAYYARRKFPIPENTFRYWTEAVNLNAPSPS
jgi:hypothetical protein